MHDLSLTAEVMQFCEASRLFFSYQEEIHKIEERMWEARQLKDASACRLEGANTLVRIEAATDELNHRMGRRDEYIRTEHGCST